ncbi:hypothetical protein HERIO_2037 [Hepatospora eriocheir]|uniref:Uncharacterized protein n=1 Tax=Hepatospora eriocheir TaxID=1081669 RepID=A0A1X0Q873_9MICR|nr:hypothetical protein HERIO_2037 [Hepatospora eriocheir]
MRIKCNHFSLDTSHVEKNIDSLKTSFLLRRGENTTCYTSQLISEKYSLFRGKNSIRYIMSALKIKEIKP